jgi:acetoin utilization deacetylase AcuC-like enzyme
MSPKTIVNSSLPLPIFIYSPGYNLELEGHVFPAVKFSQIYAKLKADPAFAQHRFFEPMPVSYEDAAIVHKRDYLQDLKMLNFSRRVYRSELPLRKDIIDAFFLATGGTVMAAEMALDHGRAMNLSGGFHHAFADHAEGFCYLNDVAIAVRLLQKRKRIKRALIIDLDVHQGNGTAKIFRHSRHVFTFSMHEEKNYPIKEKGSLDIGLESAMHDDEYLSLLEENLVKIRKNFRADLVFFVAGVDPYENDRLGGLSITKEGLAARDRMVCEMFADSPIAVVLAGGYAIKTEDTVDLHIQTAKALAGM